MEDKMKNSIIQLHNGKNYYILGETEYQNRNFILTTECDLENDRLVDEDTLYLMERKLIDNLEVIEEVSDDKIATEVTKKFMIMFQDS